MGEVLLRILYRELTSGGSIVEDAIYDDLGPMTTNENVIVATTGAGEEED